jgi:hypothetical protein
MLLELFIEIGNEIDIAYLGSARTGSYNPVLDF